MKLELQNYKNEFSFWSKLFRLIWSIIWKILSILFPRKSGRILKYLALSLFGAKIHWTSTVYSGVKIYQPWKLKMGAYSTLAEKVDCYNVDWVVIGEQTTISQDTYLCTASHDILDKYHRLITAPITIEDAVWVGARSFINMGVTLKEGCVVGGFSYVYKNVDEWSVVSGNPAQIIKMRKIRE